MARATAPVTVKAAPPKKAKAEAKAPVAQKPGPAAGKKGVGKKGAGDKPGPGAKAAAEQQGAPKKAMPPGKMAAPPKKAAAKMAAAPGKKAAPHKKAAPPNKAAPAKQAATAAKKPPVAPVQVAKKAEVRTVVVGKTVTPRRAATRVAVPVPAARRGRAPTAPREMPARTPNKAGPQLYTVSHLADADFKADGLRAYALYRDLGVAAATSGLCQAHVIRFVPPCTDEVRKRHVHKAELQLVYVLQGWMKNEFEGVGEQMMSAGSCWIQPSGIKHTVLDYSADCEVLEIIVPADFKTDEI